MTDKLIIPENKKETQNSLPLSYVMYLTIRSKFIDKFAESDSTILDKWKQFEDSEFELLEKLEQQGQL